MTKNRGSLLVSPEMWERMNRVGEGALEIARRHQKAAPPGPSEPSPARSVPTGAARPAGTTVPGRGRRKIGPETRFQAVQGRTRITPGSLRARVLDYMARDEAKITTMTALEALLGRSAARGVVGKLIEAGWLEIVS